MRKTGNKVLFALLAGAALIFAGCGQQDTGDTGGTGGGAVTDVGIAVIDPTPGVGTDTVKVTVNEGALVKKIELYVDDQKASEVTTASLAPQALEYTLTFNTAKLGDDGQPLWKNGDHVLKVVVTDAQGGTASKQTTVAFNNADYVRGILVSQDDNPKAPVTVGTTEWYGNGDVKVTVDIVNYSGAEYSLSPDPGTGNFPFTLVANGGVGPTVAGYTLASDGTASIAFSAAPSATPVSGEPAVILSKAANTTFEDDGTLKVDDLSSITVATATFGLDNVAPGGTPALQVWHPLWAAVTPSSAYMAFSGTVSWNSETYFRGTGLADGGVSAAECTIVYKVEFVDPLSNVVPVELPGMLAGTCYPAGVKVASMGLTNLTSYSVRIASYEDALGNAPTTFTPTTAGTYTPTDFAVNLDLTKVVVSNTTPEAGEADVTVLGNAGAVSTPYTGAVTFMADVFLKQGDLFVALPTTAQSVAGTGSFTAVELDDTPGPGVTTASYIYNGASYALVVWDANTYNYATAVLPLNPGPQPSDTDAPALSVSITTSLPIVGGTSFSFQGTATDPNGSAIYDVDHVMNQVSYGLEYGAAGGDRFVVMPNGPGGWSVSVSTGAFTGGLAATDTPNREGTYKLVVFGTDASYNYSFATADLQVK